MADETLVMRGSLREFALPDVLQVVGLSRQHTIIELDGSDGRKAGVIVIKAGQVLNAEAPGSRGLAAFFDLFGGNIEHFQVFRIPDARSYPAPLGSITKLLVDAIENSTTTVKAVPPAAPGKTAAKEVAPPQRTAAGSGVAALPLKRQKSRGQAAPVPRVGARSGQPTKRPRSNPPPPNEKESAAAKLAQTAQSQASTPSRAPTGAKNPVVVAIASPKGGVGKTTITLNLALSMAERGLRTVIVDADINGDILSAVNARGRVERGVYDFLDKPGDVTSALRETAIKGLRLLPACGENMPLSTVRPEALDGAWSSLLQQVQRESDIILIDCPAGMFGTTEHVLKSCTHVVGVFQAEILSSRSFSMFQRALRALPADARPKVAGVVVNMFQGRADYSIEAFHNICNEGENHQLFDTTIPRSDAFGRACMVGQPLRNAPENGTPIAFLFDMLADEVCNRVGVSDRAQSQIQSFLV